MFRTIAFFFLFSLSMGAYAQSWLQAGASIDGETVEDRSGYSVSLSDDGTIVAIGSPYHDGDSSKNNIGKVRVYKFENNRWTQLGSDIIGEAKSDNFGTSVSLSSDGTILAIGAPQNAGTDQNAGHVRVYEYSSGSWTKLGADIDGEAKNDYSGLAVSLSDDGTILAIGADGNKDGGGNDVGHVRVYEYSSGSWTKLGDDIDGEATGEMSGHSVSLSGDGTIVATGAYQANNSNGNSSGTVRVYQYSSGSWSKIGEIDGEAAEDYSGKSVSLSNNGTILAIGAHHNNGTDVSAGHVRVYEYSSGSWTKLGDDIDGEAKSDYSGKSVSLSDDGTILAVGAHGNDGKEPSVLSRDWGHVRVYKYSSGSWTKLGDDIDGESVNDQSGFSVSLSSDGKKVAIGSEMVLANGAGQTRIFHYLSDPDVTMAIDNASISETGGKAKVTVSISSTYLVDVTSTFTVSGTAASTDYKFYSVPPTDLSYTNWHTGGEPNNARNSTEHYAIMTTTDIGDMENVWNDVSNTDGGETRNYIIEVEEELTSLSSADANQSYTYLGKYQGHSYFVSQTKETSWTNARDQAFQDDGYLVVINSEAENNALAGWVDGDLIIGLYQDINDANYSEPSGGWKWVSKEKTDPLESKILVGRKSDVFYIVPNSDYVDENSETVILDINTVTNGSESGDQQVTTTITDDDDPANVTLSTSSSTQLSETSGSATIKASIPTPAPEDVTIKLGFSGTAAGTDYSYENFTTDGLMLYMPFNGNANDESGNNNNGTLHGATITEDRLGNSESALNLDGNDWVTVPVSESLQQVSDDVTISFWAYFIWGSNCHFFTGTNENPKYFSFRNNYTEGNKVRLYIRAAGQEWEMTTDPNLIQTEKWVHITYTNDMDTAYFYVDGVLAEKEKVLYDNNSPIYSLGDNIYIGSENGASDFVNGKLDEIRIYNKVLSATEIADLYTLENPILTSGIASTNSDIVIKEGKKSTTLNIIPVSDNIDEDDETVVVDIESVTNGFENTEQQLTFTITDDDDPPTVTLSADTIINESGGVSTLTATLSEQSSREIIVRLSVSGTATGSGTDYALAADSIVIAAGSKTGTTTITSVADTEDETVNETVIIEISSITNATEATDQKVTLYIYKESDFCTATGGSDLTGIVSADRKLYKSCSPYTVTGNFWIKSGATVTVEKGVTINVNDSKYIKVDGDLIVKPGATLNFGSAAYLEVNSGTLDAQGTVTDSITFNGNTSTNYDGIIRTKNIDGQTSIIKYSLIKNISMALYNTEILNSRITSPNNDDMKTSLRFNSKLKKSKIHDYRHISIQGNGEISYSELYNIGPPSFTSAASITLSRDSSQPSGSGIIKNNIFSKTTSSNCNITRLIEIHDSGTPNIIIENNNINHENSVINSSGFVNTVGIKIRSASDNISIKNNIIGGFNTNLKIEGHGNYPIKHNSFIGSMDIASGQRNVVVEPNNGFNQDEMVIDMKENYWGNVDAADINNSITDFEDDFELKGNVDFSNALTSPHTATPISSVKNLKVTRLASSTELTWDANIETDLAGYKVHYGTLTSGSYNNVIDLGNVTSKTLTFGLGTTDGITVTAYDSDADGTDDQIEGHESWFVDGEVVSAPVGVNDSYQIAKGGVLEVDYVAGILKNDIDLDGDALTATLVQTTTNGTLTLQDNGGFKYVPNAGFSGNDVFTYKATDGTYSSANTTVNISVSTPPTAADDSYSVDEDAVLTVDASTGLLSNDTDPESDAMTAVKLTDPSHGTLTLNSDGSFTYDHDGGGSTSDSFTYQASDGIGNSNTATVTITIVASDDAPVANPDAYGTEQDEALSISKEDGVLKNDSDEEGDAMTVELVTDVKLGSLSLSADGSFDYTPPTGQKGIDTFYYKVKAAEQYSNTTYATIDINGRPVIASNQTFSVDENKPNGYTVGQISIEDESSSFTWEILSGNTNNIFSIDANGYIKVNNNDSLNYERITQVELSVRAHDGSMWSEYKDITININNVNDMAIISYDITPSYCSSGDGTGAITLEIEGEEGDVTVSWSNGATTLSIENLASGTYSVTITDAIGQTINESYEIQLLPIYDQVEVCFITADFDDYTRNRIYVKVGENPYNIDKYLIWREGAVADEYELIGEIDPNEEAYVDVDVDNRSKSFRYKVSLRDKCGNTSPLSEYQETSHLSANPGIDGNINLQWTAYKGLDFSTYEIYRKVNEGDFELLTEVSSNSYAYTDVTVNPSNEYRYFVAILAEVTCAPLNEAFEEDLDDPTYGGIDLNNPTGLKGKKVVRPRTNQFYLESSIEDDDGDGVSNDNDLCPDTPSGESVDTNGCSDSQKDTDGDGVTDDKDECPNTPQGEQVFLNGCSLSQQDTDGDGVTDDKDNCPNTPTGESVDANGCPAPLFVETVTFVENVFPNPTDGNLTVILRDNIDVNDVFFVDFSGKSIKPQKIDKRGNTLHVNVSNLDEGIFLLNIIVDKEINKVKVMIER